MGKIRNVVSVFLAVLILICCRVTVAAENTQIDWSKVDLENYDYSQLEIEQWGSLGDWLREEADLHTVFYVTTTKGDGWIGEMWDDIVSSLFMKKPVSFIQALALEDEAAQTLTSYRVLYWVPDDKDGFAQLMRDLLQADIFTDAEKNVVKKIIVRAEEQNINIMIHPKTDWSKIDLENYDYSDFEMEQWQSLRDWLKKDADLHTVFYVTTTKGDGYVGELWADLVYSLFMRDPVPFIQALALEDESTQNLTSSRIAYGSPHEKDEFKQFIHQLVKTGVFTDSEQEVLKKITDFTEENTDIDTNVEEHCAGGYIIPAVLIVVVSGLAVVLLVKLRKPRDKEIGTE